MVNNDEFIERTRIYRYDTEVESYIKYVGDRWAIIDKKRKTREIDRIIYVPENYKRELSKKNLEELMRNNNNSYEIGGRFVAVFLEDGIEKIFFGNPIINIVEITPSGKWVIII